MRKSLYQSGGSTRGHRDPLVGCSRDRRLKATLMVLLVCLVVSLLHWYPQTQWMITGLTIVLAIQTVRILMAKPYSLGIEAASTLPEVAILIPAKNESAVLSDLVHSLFRLDYPSTHLDIWIVDDGSTDATPDLLRQLQTQFPALQVYRRNSNGGKSGALNAVFPLTKGEIVLVCDADAFLPADFLRRTLPLFQNPAIGAVQVRKALANANTNALTRCQQMEMDCDCFLQTHRIAAAGITELRGNGMFVRRVLLETCNGWSEDTITDDLDLTFKLYLIGSEIQFVAAPLIQEEGVTTWKQLWSQHCRWAEGGYQRYLDYFPEILSLGWNKEIDLLLFFLLQFVLPIGLIPDILWTIFYSHHPVLLPLQMLFSIIVTTTFIGGLYQFQRLRGWQLVLATVQGFFYMMHWVPIILVTILRLCVKSNSLHWVKTEHYGRTSYNSSQIHRP